MKSKMGWILIGILFIFEGIVSLMGYKIFLKYSGWVNISIYNSFYLIVVGIILCLYGYYKREKEEKFSKCPKCKETFTYSELENGKCKYCKDTDTVDIDKYFEKYPDE